MQIRTITIVEFSPPLQWSIFGPTENPEFVYQAVENGRVIAYLGNSDSVRRYCLVRELEGCEIVFEATPVNPQES